jgi:hypothetical protein
MEYDVGRIDDLANLESFDPAAFEADGKVSQDVCNFVLTLAIIYNDLKDLIHADVTLQTQAPKTPFKISRHWGAYNGLRFHVWRLMVGLFHELLYLIRRSNKVLEDSFFKSVMFQLPKEERDIWHDFVSVAFDKQTATESRFALLVRNKLVFHYDPKEIYRGYRTFFSSGSHGAERAFISRGIDMKETRLYFADAVTRGYFMKNIDGRDTEKILFDTMTPLLNLTSTLMNIIHHFIQKRGFAYRAESEET